MMRKQSDSGNAQCGLLRSALRLVSMVMRTGKFKILLHLLLTIFCGLLPAAAALLWQRILSSIHIGATQQSVLVLLIYLAIVGGLSVSYAYFTEVTDTLTRNRVSLGLQKLIHQKSDVLPMDDYESPALADMLTRASKIFCYGDAIGVILMFFYMIQQTVAIISMSMVVWHFNPLLTIIALILLVPVLGKLWLNKMQVDLDLKLSPERREADVFKQYLTGHEYIKEIYTMDAHEFFLDKWRTVTERIISEEQRSNVRVTCIRILMDILERGVTVGAYLMCIAFVLTGKIGVAEFGAVIVLMGQFIQNYSSLIQFIQEMHGSVLSVQSAIGYFDLAVEQREEKLSPPIDTIELKDVSYTYPEASRAAVQNLTLSLKNGETVAVVGKNGSGKSTLSKMVMGLINPTCGIVTANGLSMLTTEYKALYRYTTSVFQDFMHYSMRLSDNITIGASSVSTNDERLLQLLRELNITFIGEKSVISLQTELGVEFGGVDISGGQWQQLAIARAAYKDAQVVVLDEPTSALDPIREAELYETFRKLCHEKIGMIITHRLGMCAFAEHILVMDEGRMAEYGTHEELLQLGGIYSRMYRAQQELYAGQKK